MAPKSSRLRLSDPPTPVSPAQPNYPLIALLTDFGFRDHYAGVLHAVIAKIAPKARVIDITHGIPPQDIAAAALTLAESWTYFPSSTIFVAIVDPGVGTARRAIAVESANGAYFVAPDNGLLTLALKTAGLKRAVAVTSPRYRLPTLSSTFHGRDVFAPAAAYLATGVALAELGPFVTDLVDLAIPNPRIEADSLLGEVIYIDGYGNLITNLARSDCERLMARFPNRELSVTIPDGSEVKLLRTYGEAPEGTLLALFGSFERLEIAIRNASAAQSCGARVGMQVRVRAQP